MTSSRRVRVIDSHTGGEPTRTVIEGGPDLGGGPLQERLQRFRANHDDFRSAIVNEPRGSDVMVGALLCTPEDPTAATGVIFFNNVGFLGMCGHGAIGVVSTLHWQGHIGPGEHLIETPVGTVGAKLSPDSSVTIQNVASYRSQSDVSVDVPGIGTVRGDVAWGGNWFFLISDHGQTLDLDNVDQLTEFTWQVRQALQSHGIHGDNGAEIDHIELFAPSQLPGVHSKNFVLCPGKAYDRSPCGTGTSAKVACLAAAGKLKPGEVWRQESIVGSVFEASYQLMDGQVRPSITGRAWVNAEATLILDPQDPFEMGIRR